MEEFVDALNFLKLHTDKCNMMKQESRTMALNFGKEKFLKVYQEEINRMKQEFEIKSQAY